MKPSFVFLVLLCSIFRVVASEPFQLSLTPDVQWHDRSTDIAGVRIGVWADNDSFSGLDLNIAQQTYQDWSGVGFAVYNQIDGEGRGVLLAPFGINDVKEHFTGWTASTFYNRVDGSIHGWQTALVAYSGNGGKGLQSAAIAIADGDLAGVQFGAVYSHCSGEFNGLQTGLVNYSDEMNGLQLGFVNITRYMGSGVQIGLVNVIQNSPVPFLPIVNAKF